ncbi:sulfate transporter, partial [Trifolium medium]|nr:sulfate transporter [Trifolium medium]
SRVLLRNYRSKSDDVKWAQNGLVAIVINGEAIPVVQNRITDAGFGDLVLIPMGADKVFVRSSEESMLRQLLAVPKSFQTHFLALDALGTGGAALPEG